MAVTSVRPSGFAARFRLTVLEGDSCGDLHSIVYHDDNWLQATQRIADGNKLAQPRRETAGASLLRLKIDSTLH
jgi:hypothetical protein